MAELSDETIISKFKHIYEQYFDKIEMLRDGENVRFIHAEYSHPRFKRNWVPGGFCGVRVVCVPTVAVK